MRLPPTEPELGVPNMMPLIDVVFLLLIFFLMWSRFEKEERELPVNLPEVSQAQPLVMTAGPGDQHHRGREVRGRAKQIRRGAARGPAGADAPEQSAPAGPDPGRRPGHLEDGVRVMGLCNKAKIENTASPREEK